MQSENNRGSRSGVRRCIISPFMIFLFLLSTTFCSITVSAAKSTAEGGSNMQDVESSRDAVNTIDVVLIGASYAQGLQKIELPGVVVINKGVGGQQSFELLDRFHRDVVELHPGKVIIWGFINDIFRSDSSERTAAVARIKESFQEMVRLSRENNITPILATEITLGTRGGLKETVAGIIGGLMGKTSYQERVNSYVMEVNEWLKAYASEQGLAVLDFQEALADEKGLVRKKEYTQEDGSHVSEEGYRILSQLIHQNADLFE
jgi:lysophospholipase L1-like esterase